MKTLSDIIAFNEKNRQGEMPFFGQQIIQASQARGSLTDDAYRTAVRAIQRTNREDGIDVPASAGDFQAGHDPVLDWAIAQLAQPGT